MTFMYVNCIEFWQALLASLWFEAFRLQGVFEMLEKVIVGFQCWLWTCGLALLDCPFFVDYCRLCCCWIFWYISSIWWQYFSAVIVSPRSRQLWWIRRTPDHQPVTIFWCSFSFGRCCVAWSRNSHYSRNGSFLLRRIRAEGS